MNGFIAKFVLVQGKKLITLSSITILCFIIYFFFMLKKAVASVKTYYF